ncbi:MAG TPA: Ig-like domain-containing protein [Patescibacteria group bacterium]
MKQKPFLKKPHPVWDKRIPTLLGLVLIIIGIALTSYLVQIGAIPWIKAAPSENPENIRVTNISSDSFTVTYTTAANVIGTVEISKDQNISTGQVFLDDRDQATGTPTQHMIHSITVRNLQPGTQYYFGITSGQTSFLNQGSPFTQATGPTIADQPSNEDPLSGLLLTSTGDKPTDAIVYITADGGQTLSTLVKSSGIYIIPLNTLRTTDNSKYLKLTSETKFQLLAISPTEQSHAIISATKRNPIPTITLSNDYDFTGSVAPVSSTSAVFIGFPVFSLNTNVQATPQINVPQANQNFTDQQPVLSGKALPDATVQITIHSNQAISATVTADQYGNWTYRPASPLAPGQHTITITTKDQFGIMKTIEQTFSVFPPGTQVAEAATPSATLGPSAIPTISPTPITQASVTPNASASPTVITPSAPTPTTQSLLITSTPSKQIPPTGSNSVVTFGIVGLATTVIGILLFLSSKGAAL